MRLLFPLLFLILPLTLAARSTATSFCKCICFNNSTIIALNPPSSSPSPTHPSLLHRSFQDDKKTQHRLTCADCNRAFCLDYNLPICKNAREEDVFTTCFQRDSLKDETVVVVFIIATAGLLGWALIKPWVDKVRESRYSAVPAPHQGTGGFGRGALNEQERRSDRRGPRREDNGEDT